MNEISRSNRILGYSFLASLAFNFAWIALVSHSGIFGGVSSAALHAQRFQLYTPITVTPKPILRTMKPIRVTMPPPRPVTRPMPHRVARVQPARPAPRPTPPLRRMALLPRPTLLSKPQTAFHRPVPAPVRHEPSPKPSGPKGSAAPASSSGEPVMTDTSGASTSSGERRTRQDLIAQGTGRELNPLIGGSGGNTPIAPRNVAPDDSGARENLPKTPPPSESHEELKKTTPLNYDSTTEQRSEPETIGDFQAPDTSNLDTSTLTRDCVLTIYVNEDGHANRVVIKQSSGNSDYDNRCIEIAKRKHYRPAVQNHVAYPSQFEHNWGS